MKRAKISICIPTFNRGDLIGATLQSVANQTIKPAEVIVIDNASTDNTKEVVKQFSHHGIKYTRNAKNIGMAGNYNKCIQTAKYEHFTILPSDDIIAPTWYEKWSHVVLKHRADMYVSPLTIMTNDYKPIWALPIFPNSRLVKQPHVMKEFCNRFTPGVAPVATNIFTKTSFKQIPPFDSSEGPACDVRPMHHLFHVCSVYYYHHYLFAFRQHDMRSFDQQKEARANKFLTNLKTYFSILNDIYKTRYKNQQKHRYYLHSSLFMTLCNINLYAIRGEFSKIASSYKLAFKYFPDLFRKPKDYPTFLRFQLELIRRGLTMKRIPKNIQKQIAWIKTHSL